MASDTTQIAGIEPIYSAREAAAVLKRSYSWLDQRLRRGEFVAADGSVLEALRAANGYRFFSSETLREIAMYCYRRRWYTFDELKSVLRQLAMDVQCGHGDDEIPTIRDYGYPGGPRRAVQSADTQPSSARQVMTSGPARPGAVAYPNREERKMPRRSCWRN